MVNIIETDEEKRRREIAQAIARRYRVREPKPKQPPATPEQIAAREGAWEK